MFSSSRRGFTLIEIAVVVAIVAVIAVLVVMTFRPSVILAQVRDSRRMVDMDTLTKVFYARGTEATTGFGTLKTVYVSLPDSSPTCANLNLPGLPGDFTYHCAPASTLTKIDGTGWFPLDLTQLSSGAPLSVLPVDPINSAEQNLYYTYTCTSAGCEFNAVFESAKRLATLEGADAKLGIYAKGKTGITPGRRDMTLAAWWKFDDGSGSTLTDSGDLALNGTLINGPTWVSGQVDGALHFDYGDGAYVEVPDSTALRPAQITVATWLNPTTLDTAWESAITKTSSGSWSDGWGLASFSDSEDKIYFFINNYWTDNASTTLPLNTWSHVVGTYDGVAIKLYVNGVLVDTHPYSTPIDSSTSPVQIGDAHGYPWNGSIDDTKIYNRALSAEEVAALYASY